MRPWSVSATKMSPLGAVISLRGASRPCANRLTLKPSGTLGLASAGRGTILLLLLAEVSGAGAGRSDTRM